jgi:hypothetical protein
MRGGLDESILFIVISSMTGSAAKIPPEKSTPKQNAIPVMSRQRASPTLLRHVCAAGRWVAGLDCDCVCGARLFMMDVRMLLLIIGVGRKAPALE